MPREEKIRRSDLDCSHRNQPRCCEQGGRLGAGIQETVTVKAQARCPPRRVIPSTPAPRRSRTASPHPCPHTPRREFAGGWRVQEERACGQSPENRPGWQAGRRKRRFWYRTVGQEQSRGKPGARGGGGACRWSSRGQRRVVLQCRLPVVHDVAWQRLWAGLQGLSRLRVGPEPSCVLKAIRVAAAVPCSLASGLCHGGPTPALGRLFQVLGSLWPQPRPWEPAGLVGQCCPEPGSLWRVRSLARLPADSRVLGV